MPTDPLERYRAKRDFDRTSEPAPKERQERGEQLSFVVQKHAARRLHYDFRLELDGVLVSWAVPKGPSFDPAEKRIAVRTEDHPLAYASFEGTIPPKQYGAGTVIVWDRGTWQPAADPHEGLVAGKLVFTLRGEKLGGLWELVRIQKKGEKQEPWLLFKKRDAWARPLADYDVISALPDSVVTKPLEENDLAAARAALAQAPSASLPRTLAPQLATLALAAPPGHDWLYEIKFDGYRIVARIEKGKVQLFTRKGHDWTARMTSLAREVEALGFPEAWLDGEAVVLGTGGLPDFNALQNAFEQTRTEAIVYFLFDVPYLDGKDLRALGVAARRALLRDLLDAKSTGERIRFSADFPADAASVLDSARRIGLEGVIAKRRDAAYESARTSSWLKLKSGQRQEFVVGGFTDRAGAVGEVGSLLLGVHGEQDDGGGPGLRSVGSVGTGWDAQTAAALHKRLVAIERDDSPFAADAAPAKGRWSRRVTGSERWVEPRLVVEVAFTEWTPDGHIRHPLFKGLRADKPAREVVREIAAPATVPAAAPSGSSTIRISNPERVIDASTGLKKRDLVRYYESVAARILPHLAGRPVSLVRGPTGIGGELFFQKHGEKLGILGIRELDPALWPGHEKLLEVDNAEALVGCAQMNVIEFHTWNAKAARIDHPDRMIFDLDPGEGVAWPQVREAAILVRALLEELDLASWLKTSGGKGLHVAVPIAPRVDYDTVKDFSQAIVEHLAATIPERFVARSGAGNRVGRIFVDYLRNGHGATTAAAFSARARPGLGVSMPIDWDELPSLNGGAQWTIATAREHLSFETADPWGAYAATAQSLAAPMKRLGFAAGKRPRAPARKRSGRG